jgi:3-hydroxyisobutyrate dehydrogenase
MPNQIRRVGVVGLGAMGMGIAQSLLRAGFEVHAYDVRPEAVARITEAGAHGADTPAALGSRVEALIIVVVTAQQTDAVLFGDQGAAATMTPGSIVIASATVSPEFAQQLGDRLEAMGA